MNQRTFTLPRHSRQRYRLHMLHASISVKAENRQAYSLHSFYQREHQWSAQASQALNQLYEKLRAVVDTANQFDLSQLQSGINARIARVSEEGCVSVIALPQAMPTRFSLEVKQIAQAQINQGYELDGEAPTLLSGGLNTFEISLGKENYAFSFFVFASDTIGQCLSRMAATINQQRMGVSAVVQHRENRCRLILTAQSGEAYGFTIRDTLGVSVRITGINQVVTPALDAIFQLDGQDHSSAVNQLRLVERGVELTLQSPTPVPIHVTVSINGEQIIAITRNLVDHYNQLLLAVNQHIGLLARDLPEKWWHRTVNEHDWRLIGIFHNEQNGLLSFQAEQLQEAIDYDFSRVKQLLGGEDGLAVRMCREAFSWRNTPPARFVSMSIDEETSNPYQVLLFPHLFLRHAAKTSLFYNHMF